MNRVALNVALPEPLHRKLKAKAAMEGLTLKEAVEQAVEGFVGEDE